MENNLKQNLFVTAFGVTLFAVLFHLSEALSFCRDIFHLILPIIAGGILAIFINVPVNGIEKRMTLHFKNKKKKPSEKAIHIFSFIATLLCVFIVFVLILTQLMPEIIRTSQNLYAQLKVDIPEWLNYLDKHNINIVWLDKFLADINPEQAMQGLTDDFDRILTNIADMLSSTVNVVISAGFAFIISIYIILEKKRLCRHTKKLVYAYLKPGLAESILKFCQKFSQSFTNFLTGQCTEAIILGILMFLAFTIFNLPYGSLVGILTAVCSIIPYVGAFISSAVSVLLTLLIDPTLVFRCLVVYSAVQFIENQFIYPRVVGSSVGLPPLYTLVAAMIGGKLFGILGIIFFIPLAAVAIELIKENAGKRLHNYQNNKIAREGFI